MTAFAYVFVWLFAFALPWESTLAIMPGVGVIGKATGVLALGATLAVVVMTGRVRRWHHFHIAALLFICWLIFHLFVFRTSVELPNTFWTFVQLFLVLWIMWELAASWDRVIGLLTAYVLGAHIAAVDTILTYHNSAAQLRRFAAGGIDANDLAMMLALALPMAWYLGMSHRSSLLRWVCRAYLAIGLFAIGLTGSRGGMLATVVALTIVPFTMLRLSPGKRNAAIAMLVLAGVLGVAFVPQRIFERLATTTTEVEQGRISGRGRIWKAGLVAFAEHPVVGYGPGGFRTAVRPYLGSGTQVAHNSYLSVLVEEGLIGFAIYATMLGSVWVAVLRLPLLERRFALVLLSTLAIAMFPLSWEERKPVWFVMAVLLGLSQAARGVRQAQARPSAPPPTGRVAPSSGGRRMQPVLTSRDHGLRGDAR